jgi:hypothetical protein
MDDSDLLKQEIEKALKQARSDLAKAGGLARAKSMTAKQRKASAMKASKAAAAARTKKARAKKGARP